MAKDDRPWQTVDWLSCRQLPAFPTVLGIVHSGHKSADNWRRSKHAVIAMLQQSFVLASRIRSRLRTIVCRIYSESSIVSSDPADFYMFEPIFLLYHDYKYRSVGATSEVD